MAGDVLQSSLFVYSDDESGFMKIASAYDIPARRVMTREELEKRIDEMIATDGAFLLEAVWRKKEM